MANNVIDAAIRLRDLFTPTVRSVNASLGDMKTQMAAAKQSVSGLSDKMALLSAPIYISLSAVFLLISIDIS